MNKDSLNHPNIVDTTTNPRHERDTVSAMLELSWEYDGLDILGPASCHFEKIKNNYRVQLIFKSLKKSDPNSKRLQLFIVRNFIKNRFAMNSKKCKINIHRDPLSLV